MLEVFQTKLHNWDVILKLCDARSLAKAMRLLFITNTLVSCSSQFQRGIENPNSYSLLLSEVVDKRTHQQHLASHWSTAGALALIYENKSMSTGIKPAKSGISVHISLTERVAPKYDQFHRVPSWQMRLPPSKPYWLQWGLPPWPVQMARRKCKTRGVLSRALCTKEEYRIPWHVHIDRKLG